MAAMAKAHAERVGRRARERRDELELTQKQVANLMTDSPSVDGQVISNWERGVHRPTDDHLEMWAAALQTTVADLYAGPQADRGGPTPDVMGQLNGNGPAGDLAQIEQRLTNIEASIAELVAWSQSGPTRKELESRINALTDLAAETLGGQRRLHAQLLEQSLDEEHPDRTDEEHSPPEDPQHAREAG